MKSLRLLLTFIVLNSTFQIACAQANEWTWVNGDSTVNNNSVYGAKGIAAPANKPGSRWLSVSFTGKDGNLWLYGGSSDASRGSYHLNDLWQYNTGSNEWRWMGGDTVSPINGLAGIYGMKEVAAPGNKPGGKDEAVSWVDTSGNLWLFGGGGPDASSNNGLLNDLWEYNTGTNEWAWVSGDSIINQEGIYGTQGIASAGNKPGSRTQGVTWTDHSNNLWMFGGAGYDALGNYGELDDLWMFSLSADRWIWVDGDSVVSINSIYGTKGVAAPQNKPGGRVEGVSWEDNAGNLWLFGGYGYPAHVPPLELNDLWKYTIINNEWTWVSGDTVIGIYGHYGTQGIMNAENKPGSARWSISWADYSGNFWLFGGYGYGGGTNALWKFNVATGQWAWMTGDTTGGIFGVYGTEGVAYPANTPGTRQASISWTGTSGDLWLFGGDGYPASTVNGNLNDLWKFHPGLTVQLPVAQFSTSVDTICAGSVVPFTDQSTGSPASWNWTFAGGAPGISTAQNPTVAYDISGTYNVTLVVSNSGGADSLTKTSYIVVNPLPVPVVATNDSAFCSGDSAQVCSTGNFASYHWNTGDSISCTTAKVAGGYWVTVTDSNHCSAVSGHQDISVYPVPSVSITVQGDTLSSFGALSYQWILNGNAINHATGPVYVANEQGSYTVQVTDSDGCTAISSPVMVSGISELAEGSVSLYPNPSVGSWRLAVGNSLVGSALEIFDDEGRLVWTDELRVRNYELTATTLAKGVYWLRISNANTSIVRKLVRL